MENLIKAERDALAASMRVRGATYRELYLNPNGVDILNFWAITGFGSYQYNYKLPQVLHATNNISLAVTKSKDTVEVADFIRAFESDCLLDGQLRDWDLVFLLNSYFAAFDHLFFFGALTCPQPLQPGPGFGQRWFPAPAQQRNEVWPAAPRRTVSVIPNSSWNGKYYGRWTRGKDFIEIVTHDASGRKIPIVELLCTLIHEMTHAYIDIFMVCTSLEERLYQVVVDGGHGRAFCDINLFSLYILSHWSPNIRLKNTLMDNIILVEKSEDILAEAEKRLKQGRYPTIVHAFDAVKAEREVKEKREFEKKKAKEEKETKEKEDKREG